MVTQRSLKPRLQSSTELPLTTGQPKGYTLGISTAPCQYGRHELW